MQTKELCQALRELQRQRACNLKSRIMIENRLTASVATSMGYCASMDEKQRKKRFEAAKKLIKEVRGDRSRETEDATAPLILATSMAIDGFDAQKKAYEKEMEQLAKNLPVFDWVSQPEQNGFGLLSLAKVVGECGDLSDYPAPGKLWKRMGCAPFESRGQMKMPSTWRRSKPSLSAEEWESCGYSPRRRSEAYLIGDTLMKGNGNGPYRERYLEVKRRAAEVHPEWFICGSCKGTGKTSRGSKCDNCKGTGEVKMHAHLHAMLLATKLLLKCLWIEWTGGSVDLADSMAIV